VAFSLQWNSNNKNKRKGDNKMKTLKSHLPTSVSFSLAAMMLTILLPVVRADAQCEEIMPVREVISGLREPLGTALTNQGNLLVSETGTTIPNSGRISIINPNGNRRTLLDGLPSAINDVFEPSGPAGLFMRGRTLYVAMGVGDVGRPGPGPGTTIPNPVGPSSPLYSSILAIQFSSNSENTTTGFTLTAAQQQALAAGEIVSFSNHGGQKMTIRMVVDFPDYVSFPLPTFPANVQLSNPFGLTAIDDTLFVTDGGRNRVWQVDLLTGSFSTLVTFPPIPNPLFGVPGLPGGPFLDAVPTGIAVSDDKLLVTLFRGVPFPQGTSTVEQVDPITGGNITFISGRKNAIDVFAQNEKDSASYFVLQHASVGPFFGSPGLVLRFDDPAGPPVQIARCLARPTSMTPDPKTNTLYVSEYGGRLLAISIN
jgi:hypothetical protein